MRSVQATRPDAGFQMEQGESSCSVFNCQPSMDCEQREDKAERCFPGSLPWLQMLQQPESHSQADLSGCANSYLQRWVRGHTLSGPQVRDIVTSDR